eukprot:CAMPEP_0173243510 /NCGR_PEP_ID=MMETSP1142-20121109/15543_1 /TAXON_ID=483371 /ORGANISM="non described non described, Strain CCMP2298" /LENGTH=96 /DNA_ID=CAMNT_0014175113 /DNA_START=265 /DNA_END=556 /DNA_ORIENTATION=-
MSKQGYQSKLGAASLTLWVAVLCRVPGLDAPVRLRLQPLLLRAPLRLLQEVDAVSQNAEGQHRLHPEQDLPIQRHAPELVHHLAALWGLAALCAEQ